MEDIPSEFMNEGSPAESYPLLCFVCEEEVGCSACTRCRYVSYCSKSCQREDWPTHKLSCKVTLPAHYKDSTLQPDSAFAGLPKKVVYGMLIDAFRLRMDEEYVINQALYGLYSIAAGYGGDQPSDLFHHFIRSASKRGKLPSWWKPVSSPSSSPATIASSLNLSSSESNPEMADYTYPPYPTGDTYLILREACHGSDHNLSHAVESSDIETIYGFFGKLRIRTLGKEIYGWEIQDTGEREEWNYDLGEGERAGYEYDQDWDDDDDDDDDEADGQGVGEGGGDDELGGSDIETEGEGEESDAEPKPTWIDGELDTDIETVTDDSSGDEDE